jgi:hypothetical protein
MAKLTESLLRSIIREELSNILELDEAMSAEERKQKKKRDRAKMLRRNPEQGYKGFQRDIFDSDDPEAPSPPVNPGMSRYGN